MWVNPREPSRLAPEAPDQDALREPYLPEHIASWTLIPLALGNGRAQAWVRVPPVAGAGWVHHEVTGQLQGPVPQRHRRTFREAPGCGERSGTRLASRQGAALCVVKHPREPHRNPGSEPAELTCEVGGKGQE